MECRVSRRPLPSIELRRVALLLLMTVAVSPVAAADEVAPDRGAALFHGKEPLTGRIRGHDQTLPPPVVRCANCHASASMPRRVGVQAPRLDARFLTGPRQRRGGPPTAYEQESFCRVLREAVDPGFILVAREMPVYVLSDAQCASLWSYLSRDGSGPARDE